MYKDIYIDNVRLHIFQENNYPNRPILVFLHESFGCIDLWKDFPTALGEMAKCNILVYDRQGYGKSEQAGVTKRDNDYLEKEADVLNKILTQLDISDAILFGHSDGGSIALIAAAKYPERIKAIVTEGAHVFVEEITLKGIRDAVEKWDTSNLKQRLEKYHADNTESVFWLWANTWLSNIFRNWNIEHFLPKIDCPTLIIQGEKDEYGTIKQVEAILQGIGKNSKQLIVPNNGHSPHITAKDTVLKDVAKFIDDL